MHIYPVLGSVFHMYTPQQPPPYVKIENTWRTLKGPYVPFPSHTLKLTIILTSVTSGHFILLNLKCISFKFIASPTRLWLWKNSFGETWWRISKWRYSYFIHQKEKTGKYSPSSLSSVEISLAGHCLWANMWYRCWLWCGETALINSLN